MNLDPTIQTILSMTNINQFTVVEIRTAYIALIKDEGLDAIKIRKLVYSQLHKLVRKGWLNTSTSEIRKITSFTKTDLFSPQELEVLKETNNCSKASLHCEFKQELKFCNTELLEGLGELEVYSNLWEKYPHMQNVLKSKYIATQEKNHILKGKINAFSGLLKNSNEKYIK
jgi:hypothetical protein